MGNTADKLKALFTGLGQPNADELSAAATGTLLLRQHLQDDALLDGLVQVGRLLERQAEPGADPQRWTALQKLLASRSLDDRLAGAQRLRDEVQRLFMGHADLPEPELIKVALDRLGPALLHLDPEIGPAYQRYLQRRTQAPMSFERWLRKTDAARVRKRLAVLGLDAWRRSLAPANALHVPAKALLQLDGGTLKAMSRHIDEMAQVIERMAGVKIDDAVLRQLVLDKLDRKVKHLLDGSPQAREQVLALFRPGGLSLDVSVRDPKVFLRGDLSNLQSNIGEIFALPAQIQRLAAAQAGRRGQRIVLATDVRFGGSKLVPDSAGTRAPRSSGGAEPPSQPMVERELSGLEFSDDMIIDLGTPPRLRIVEHHENKVTLSSIDDAVSQIDDNAERIEFAGTLSFGQLYELVDGRLVPLDPASLRLPPAALQQGWALDGTRLSVSEAPQAREKVAAIQQQLQQHLDELDAETGLDAAGRVQATEELLRQASAAERQHQNLIGLHSSDKVIFTPEGQPGRLPDHVVQQSLGHGYDAFISLCNLLLAQGPFQRRWP